MCDHYECGWSWPFCEVNGHHSGHKNVAVRTGVPRKQADPAAETSASLQN